MVLADIALPDGERAGQTAAAEHIIRALRATTIKGRQLIVRREHPKPRG